MHSSVLSLLILALLNEVNIPGVTNKYNSENAVNALMDAERIPLVRMEQDLQVLKDQKTAWTEVNRKVQELRDAAKNLFGFQNPFGERTAESSQPNALSAIASRAAPEDQRTITVLQTAAADRFLTRPLAKDNRASAGTYRFRVGSEEVQFVFSGGSLKELAAAINAKAGTLLKASVVETSSDSQVLVIESKKTGSRNPLTLHDQALAFAEATGMMERVPALSREIPLPAAAAAGGKPQEQEGALRVDPQTEFKIPLEPPVVLSEDRVLEIEVRTQIIPEEPTPKPSASPGPELPDPGGIIYEGIEIQNARSRFILPSRRPQEPTQRVDDMQIFFAECESDGRTVPLAPLLDSESFYPFQVQSGQAPGPLSSLDIRNRNTHRILYLRNLRVREKNVRGESRPLKPLSTAQDAKILMDGVEITRESNRIDDLLPGVTLTINGLSSEPVKLAIRPNPKPVKEAVISLVGRYNQLLTHLDILTRKDESVIEDAQFLSDEEREKAQKNLGLFQGNISLMQLKGSLQRVMMNPYPTEGGRELSLLAQIGVSTTAGSPTVHTGSLDKTRLRGYLLIDEPKLDQSLSQHPDWIKELFGNDTDGDLIVDAGVGYSLEATLRPYTEMGGLIPGRLTAMNGQIDRKNREISSYKKHLTDYEKQIRKKYGVMEGALDNLEQSSRSIENFNNQLKQ